MDKIAILIPTLNRITHLKKCIESLKRNTYSGYADLYISVDHPPGERYKKGYEEVKEFVKTVSGFNSVTTYIHEDNLGPKENFRFLERIIFDRDYDFFITCEDDNEFAPNYLEFMVKGAEKFKDDPGIFALCPEGSLQDIKSIEGSYLKRYMISGWGVGLWKDKYIKMTEEIDALADQIAHDAKKCNKLLKTSPVCYQALSQYFTGEMPAIIEENGKVSIIDYTYTIYCIMNEKKSVFPVINLVRNNGGDGSGVNSPDGDVYPGSRDLDERLSFEFKEGASFEEDSKKEEIRYREAYSVKRSSLLRAGSVFFLRRHLKDPAFGKLLDHIIH